VDPDPLQFVRAQHTPEDREVIGLLAACLAYGNVRQIKRSIGTVVDWLGPRPAEAVARLDPRRAARSLEGFKHRFNTGRDVACLLFFMRQMRARSGSLDAFFARGHDLASADVEAGLTSFVERALALDHGGLYGASGLPAEAGVRFFLPSPAAGSACKRLNLFLRWMVRRDGVDPGAWRAVSPAQLVIPLDAHVFTIARRLRLTRYRSAGWPMAMDITRRLRQLDAEDPVKYDFAFHRMGLWKKEEELLSLGARPRARRS
jgi:uncharacterized protein (TIGR02757 family)